MKKVATILYGGISGKSLIIITLLLIFTGWSASAQFVITYPGTAQQPLTVCYGQSTLTVRVDAAVVSSNNTVTIQLPTGVEYVAGSVAKTAGTASLTIAESNIANLNAPVFAISPASLAASDNITFSIARVATCAARTWALAGNAFRDITTVTGSGGSKSYTPVVGYNVDYPSFSMVQPTAITDAVVGGTYTRTFNVKNGASGSAGHVYLYIEYPSAGIELQSLTLGGNTLTPTSVAGDRLYFDITGTQLGTDALFSNGEVLTFTENIKVKKCGANTLYGTGWGSSSNPAAWCQSATGTGAVTMATGTANLTNRVVTDGAYVNMCTPLDRTYTVSNTGTGNTFAAAMYDMKVRIYDDGYGYFSGINYTISNVNIGGTIIPPANYTFGSPWPNTGLYINLDNLIPVGAGDPLDGPSGLADTDGDGFYDDLPAGNNLAITWTQQFICDKPCGYNVYESYLAFEAQYHTMCNKSTYTAQTLPGAGALLAAHYLLESTFSSQSYIPANIQGGTPFTISLAAGWNQNYGTYNTPKTRYRWTFTLPAGFSVSGTGNATYNGLPVNPADLVINGNTVTYTFNYTPIGSELFTRPFKIDLVYSCPVDPCNKPSNATIPYTLMKINDITSSPECICQGQKVCGTLSSDIFCPGVGCIAGGPSTDIPQIRRVDASLGWTDKTLTTRQVAANISDYDLRKAIYLDTLQFSSTAIQHAVASDNLHLSMSLTRTAASEDKLQALTRSYVEVWRGGIKLTEGMFTTPVSATSSTATTQVIDWDLTAALPVGGLQPDDVVKTITKAFVRINIPHALDVQTGVNWSYYNQLPAPVTYNNCGTQVTTDKLSCNSVIPEMYITGYTTYTAFSYVANTLTGCENLNMVLLLTSSFAIGNKQYASEVKPMMQVNTVDFEIPDGYDFVSAKGQNNVTGITYSGLTPSSVNGRVYRFTNPCGPNPLMLTVLNGYSGSVTVTVKANCSVPATGTFKSTAEVSHQQYVYYPNAALPQYHTTYNYNSNVPYNLTTKPTINLTNQTGTVQAYQPQHNWTVRMSNSSSNPAPYTWLGIPAKAGVNVVSVTDVATGTPLTPITYSGGAWYQISSSGLAAGTYKDYRIDFTYTSCNNDYLTVIGGWNCSAFPTDPTAYTCGNNAINLPFNPQVSEVELTADILPPANVDLCTLIDYAYHITSVQAGNTTNNKINLKCPTGMNPVPGSFEVEYPFGAGNWAAITPVVSGDDYLYDLTTHPAYPTQGLPGTLATTVTANRQMGIRFKMTTNCSFVANTNFSIDATANRPCGEAAIGNGLVVQGPSTGINGINPAYQTINVLSSTDMLNCSQQATITVKSTVVAGTTGTGDVMKISLPKGISMIPGSFTQIDGGSVSYTGSTTLPTGITELHYQIPAGLNGGDHMEFSIKVIDGVETTCGTNRIDVQTSAIFENVACGTLFCPTVGGETGKGGVDFIDRRPQIDVSSASGCLNPATNNYDVNFTLANSGTSDLLSANPFTLKFYCNDGTGNPTGAELATFSQGIDINMGGTYTGSISFARPVCASGLVAVVSKDDNCVCATSAKSFRVTELLKPAINTGLPTCSADAPATITNYDASNTYVFSPTGPTVGAGGVISGLVAGQKYSVIVSKDGCSSPASNLFSVNAMLPTPVVSLAPVGSVCANVPAFALYGSPVGGTFSGTGVTGNRFDPATAGAGAHMISYSYTNSLGCTATASTTATVLAAPDLTLSPASQTICSGTAASLTASGHNGATVTWSANMLLPSAAGTNYTTGVLKNAGILPYTIKLTATAQTGSCASQAVGSITVLPEPKVTVVPRSAVVCSYETPRFTLSAATSGTTISWQLKNAGGTVLQSGSGAGSITLPTLASGNYTLEVTGTGNGCTSVLNVPLTVN